jgi:hypothetical protein
MLRLAANLLHCFIYGQSKRSPKAQRVSPPKLFVVPDAVSLSVVVTGAFRAVSHAEALASTIAAPRQVNLQYGTI